LALALMVIFVLVALLNLGLMSISGNGLAVARYQTADAATLADDMRWSFDDIAEGALPDGAEVLSQSRFGGWAVRGESDAPCPPNALCQTGMAEYPSIALSNDVVSDAVKSARFKPISGMVDQAAGLLFRIQDADNYYILRANALEGNVNFYKYASGRRSPITEGRATVASGQWQGSVSKSPATSSAVFSMASLWLRRRMTRIPPAARVCGPKRIPSPASTMCSSPSHS
jgi:hypothetical protein